MVSDHQVNNITQDVPTLVFCGKKNCCPEFVKSGDKVALKDDFGKMAYLSKEELLDMAKMFRTHTDDEILTSLGFK